MGWDGPQPTFLQNFIGFAYMQLPALLALSVLVVLQAKCSKNGYDENVYPLTHQ